MKEGSPKERELLPRVRLLDPKAIGKETDIPSGLKKWIVEYKFDGVRTVSYIEKNGQIKLVSEGGLDGTLNFPELHPGLVCLAMNHSVILDGEIIVGQGKKGMGRFATSRWLAKPPTKITRVPDARLVVFDILYLDGENLTARPLVERKAILQELIPPRFHRDYRIEVIEFWGAEEAEDVMDSAKENGFEGILLKKKDSIYSQRPGKNPNWLKFRFPSS